MPHALLQSGCFGRQRQSKRSEALLSRGPNCPNKQVRVSPSAHVSGAGVSVQLQDAGGAKEQKLPLGQIPTSPRSQLVAPQVHSSVGQSGSATAGSSSGSLAVGSLLAGAVLAAGASLPLGASVVEAGALGSAELGGVISGDGMGAGGASEPAPASLGGVVSGAGVAPEPRGALPLSVLAPQLSRPPLINTIVLNNVAIGRVRARWRGS